MNVQRFIFWILVVAVIVPSSVQAQKVERAVLAFGSNGGNLTPFWVAREAGLYRKYGVDVDVVFLRGSTTAINAMVAREAQFGALGASSSVLANLGGADTVLIATAAPGLSFYLVVNDKIKKPADLKGKKIGISRPGTDSDLAARVAVQKSGLNEKDVKFINTGGTMERVTGMKQGVIDATVMTPGAYTAARKLGFHALFDLSKLNFPYEAASLITTRTLIKENPDLVSRFSKGFVAGIHYSRTHRDFTIKVLKKYMRTDDPDVLAASYDYYVEGVIPKVPYVSEKGLQAVLDFSAQRNPQAKTAKVQDFMDNEFIKQLDESGFIKTLYER
jgi:NitT/TauT family transport system substrate-binding protein